MLLVDRSAWSAETRLISDLLSLVSGMEEVTSFALSKEEGSLELRLRLETQSSRITRNDSKELSNPLEATIALAETLKALSERQSESQEDNLFFTKYMFRETNPQTDPQPPPLVRRTEPPKECAIFGCRRFAVTNYCRQHTDVFCPKEGRLEI